MAPKTMMTTITQLQMALTKLKWTNVFAKRSVPFANEETLLTVLKLTGMIERDFALAHQLRNNGQFPLTTSVFHPRRSQIYG